MFDIARKANRRRELNGENGFTLIELLIVIIVLGILAAIVVFALGSVTGQSAVAACNADSKTVSVAVSAFEAENPGTTPTQANLTQAPSATIVGGPYLKSWPNNLSYYTIALDSSADVTVALATSTPGYKAVPTAITTAQAYDGSSAFSYTGETSDTTLNGQNICAGA